MAIDDEVRIATARLEQRVADAKKQHRMEGILFWLHTLAAYLVGALSFIGLMRVLGH